MPMAPGLDTNRGGLDKIVMEDVLPNKLVSLILGSLFIVVGAPSFTQAWGADIDALELAGRWVKRGKLMDDYYDLSPTGSKSFRLSYTWSEKTPRADPIPGISMSRGRIKRKVTAIIDGRRITGEYYYWRDLSGFNCRHPGITAPITGIISEDGRRIVIVVPKHRGIKFSKCSWEDYDGWTETFYRK